MMTIKIPPTLTETQARVYESYIKWYSNYFTVSPLLAEQKEERMKRDLKIARAFNDELRSDIGLPPKEHDDGPAA
jgi:hypothetical protein